MFAGFEDWASCREPKVLGGEELGRILAEAVGGAMSIDPGGLSRRGRGDARTAFARHVAIYIARTRLGFSFTAAGRLFDRDRTTAAHACRRVEERRDELWADELIERIDRAVGQRAASAVRQECAA